MSHAEGQARALVDRLDASAALVGVEVGVYRGEMSAHLLRLCPRLTLHMVDSWAGREEQPASYRATGDPRAKASATAQAKAKRHAVRAVAFAQERAVIYHGLSLSASRIFPDGALDFVFIDADHSYEGVQSDIEAWRHKVRAGGLLSGHDYVYPGERSPRGWPEVVRAVDEAVEANGWDLERGDEATWFVTI